MRIMLDGRFGAQTRVAMTVAVAVALATSVVATPLDYPAWPWPVLVVVVVVMAAVAAVVIHALSMAGFLTPIIVGPSEACHVFPQDQCAKWFILHCTNHNTRTP